MVLKLAVSQAGPRIVARRYSDAASAILFLLNGTEPSAEEQRICQNERQWLQAKSVIIHEQLGEQRDYGLQWIGGVPERNVSVSTNVPNAYFGNVFMVCYAMASALKYNEKHLFIYSRNEVLVRVANRIYKAKKMPNLFDVIREATDPTQNPLVKLTVDEVTEPIVSELLKLGEPIPPLPSTVRRVASIELEDELKPELEKLRLWPVADGSANSYSKPVNKKKYSSYKKY